MTATASEKICSLIRMGRKTPPTRPSVSLWNRGYEAFTRLCKIHDFLSLKQNFVLENKKKNKLKSMKLANPKKEFATCLEIIAWRSVSEKANGKKKRSLCGYRSIDNCHKIRNMNNNEIKCNFYENNSQTFLLFYGSHLWNRTFGTW